MMLAAFPILGAANKLDALEVPPVFPDNNDPDYWKEVRKMFPMPMGEGYMNTGTIGATPTPVLEAIIGHLKEYSKNIAHVDWSNGGIDIITGYFPHDSLRKKLGAIINADYQQIALIKNAHMGMNLVANGLDLRYGDEVIQTNKEHTGGSSGWNMLAKRKGIQIKQIIIDPPIPDPEYIVDQVKKLITPKTRVIAIPHVLSVPGDLLPVKEICAIARSKGILTVLDGAQAIGHIKVDVQDLGCDAYYASPHKWMFAPAGSAVLYLHPDLAPDLWTTLPSGAWDNHDDEGFRFTQRGTDNTAMMVGYEAAVDFHNKIGTDRIIKRLKYLGDYLRNGLQAIPNIDIQTSVHPDMCAALTTYGIKGIKGETLKGEMWKREKLQPRAVGPDGAYIRFSTHVHTSEDEIERALAVTEELAKKR